MKKIIITLTAVVMTIAVFGQTNSSIKCRIWKPTSFCDFPKSINVPGIIECSYTHEYTKSCESLDKKNNLIGVWITFPRQTGPQFDLTTGLKNISIIKKSTGDTIHPYAIIRVNMDAKGENDKYIFVTNELTTKQYTIKLWHKKYYDLIIVFDQADIGDKVIIEKYLETTIQE